MHPLNVAVPHDAGDDVYAVAGQSATLRVIVPDVSITFVNRPIEL